MGISDLPVRKNIRLQGYDYSQNGMYFITICVKDKHELLGKINVGANCVRPIMSDIGNIVNDEISKIDNIYGCVFVDKYVIMPNHIHIILQIISDDGRTQFAPTISQIIKQFKGSITKQIGYSIWQKLFYDHIIRNEKEYQQIWQYIDENPIRWTVDKFYVNDEN